MKSKLCLIFLFTFFLSLVTMKADWYPLAVNYTRATYGSGSQNWSIIQTSNSWMYFGNSYGMLQYDGIRWTTFPVDNHTCVRSLLYFNDLIYAGAEDDFGYYEPNFAGHLFFYSLRNRLPDNKLSFGNVWKIHEKDNVLYFQTEKSFLKYASDTISIIDIDEKIEYSTIANNMLWFITNNGIYYLAGDMPIALEYPILKNKKVVAILPYEEKKQLFITAEHGLYCFDGKSVEHVPTEVDDLLKTSRVFCATKNDDYIALGTVTCGLFLLNHKGNLHAQLNVNSGLSNNTILSMNFDQDDNLWLGLDDGIAFVAINSPITNLYGSASYGKGSASILKDGYLYLGTNQSLMMKKWPIQTEQGPMKLEQIKIPTGQVWSLNEVFDELFCSHDNGLYIIKGKDAFYIDNTKGTWIAKTFNKDEIITGTYDGFQVIKKEGNEWKLAYNMEGSSGPVVNFECDGNIIWKSDNQKGIAKLLLNGSKDKIISTTYYGVEKGLPATNNNAVCWIDDRIVFSTTMGIFKYNPKTDLMEPDNSFDSILPGKRPYSLLQKRNNSKDYWYIFDNEGVGFSLYDEKTSRYKQNTHSGQYFKQRLFDGFEHINPINDSCTLVGTETGFAWLNPHRNNRNWTKKPYLSIRKVWLRAETDSLIYGDSYKKINSEAVIPFKRNSLRFEFGASDFQFNSNIQYSYKLEKYDEYWSNYSTLDAKEYTKLKEGEYTFHVRAKSNYIDEPVYASFSFLILPPWYRSSLAYTVYAILSLVALLILFRFFNKIIEKKQRKITLKKDIEIKQKEEEFRRQSMLQEKEILSLKQEQLEQELKLKSNELASTIMMVRDKNEIFSQINGELNKIYETLKSSEIKKEVRRLQQKINKSKERDNYWKKFEENFDVVHEDFFKKLSERYPMLTNNDKKICALLRMNLSSKEIADLTNISVRSVELSRYRLRKKIGLEREENLTEWIHAIEKKDFNG